MSKKSDIPFAGNFSPREVSLAQVLGFAKKHGGNRKGLEGAVQAAYYERSKTPKAQRPKLAYNVVLGMEKYGLVAKDASLTEVGLEILGLAGDPVAMHRRFAQHILVNLNGTAFVRCVSDMQITGETVTLISLREALLERGIHTPTANKHMSLLRLWLDQASVTTPSWTVNLALVEELVGLSGPEIEVLSLMTPAQVAVVRVLAELGDASVDSSKLRLAAEKAHGVRINEKQMPKSVLIPLKDWGYVSFTSGKARSAPVKATAKLQSDITVPLIEQLAGALPAKLLELLRLPLADIVEKLDADKHVKGLALEALAFKMLRLAGLRYLDTRYRPKSGGRFEVDLLFDSPNLAYGRWQVQCKNTAAVALDDVAKEVGLTYYLLSSVVAVITRGRVGPEARNYAVDVMRKTNLAIVLIDGEDVENIVDDPIYIFDVLAREADFARRLKPLAGEGFEPRGKPR